MAKNAFNKMMKQNGKINKTCKNVKNKKNFKIKIIQKTKNVNKNTCPNIKNKKTDKIKK